MHSWSIFDVFLKRRLKIAWLAWINNSRDIDGYQGNIWVPAQIKKTVPDSLYTSAKLTTWCLDMYGWTWQYNLCMDHKAGIGWHWPRTCIGPTEMLQKCILQLICMALHLNAIRRQITFGKPLCYFKLIKCLYVNWTLNLHRCRA